MGLLVGDLSLGMGIPFMCVSPVVLGWPGWAAVRQEVIIVTKWRHYCALFQALCNWWPQWRWWPYLSPSASPCLYREVFLAYFTLSPVKLGVSVMPHALSMTHVLANLHICFSLWARVSSPLMGWADRSFYLAGVDCMVWCMSSVLSTVEQKERKKPWLPWFLFTGQKK